MNKFLPNNYKYIKIRKKLKFKKNKELKHINLKIGKIGLKCLESGRITATMLEVIRKIVIRKIKKIGKMLIFIHTNVPTTKKSAGMRMGKGSGSLDLWMVPVKKGKIIIELVNVPINLGKLVLKSVSVKLPMKTKIIINNN